MHRSIDPRPTSKPATNSDQPTDQRARQRLCVLILAANCCCCVAVCVCVVCYWSGFMLLVYIILVVVTVCVTIVSTYFLLNAEDYRWQWTSFLAGGSTALYVYLYAIYYYTFKTRMSGMLQTSYFFGYMAVFCFSLFILCGTLGYIGTNLFVRKIYQYIKAS